MPERDKKGVWQQILTSMGIGSIPEEEWEDIWKDYQLSWDKNFGNRARVGAVARKGPGPSPVMKHRSSTAPGGAVASSHVKRRKTSPLPSTPVASSFKRRNFIASPSTPTRRNSMTPPSTCTRRNSMTPPSTRTPRPFSLGQAWDSSFFTPELMNFVAAHGLKDVKDFMPFIPLKRQDSVALEQEMNLKKSGSSVNPSAAKRRNSSVSASAKVQSKQKPMKHVTGSSDDELDDDQNGGLTREEKAGRLKEEQEPDSTSKEH